MDKNTHSVFLLQYHLVLTSDRLQSIFTQDMISYLQDIFNNICGDYDIIEPAWSWTESVVAIDFRAKPSSEISKFINAYKSASSRRLKTAYPEIGSKLSRDRLWSQSFLLMTYGEVSEEAVRDFVEKQRG